MIQTTLNVSCILVDNFVVLSSLKNVIRIIQSDWNWLSASVSIVWPWSDTLHQETWNLSEIALNFHKYLTSNASLLKIAETSPIENSYSSSSIVPLSDPKIVNHWADATGYKAFFTAFWIVFAYFTIAACKFAAFSLNFQKITTSSSVFKWIFFFSFWILLMSSLANPRILSSSFCLVSKRMMTRSPPMAWYSWMFSATNLSLIMISS